ncbi:MAG: 30S ribosomal protein S9 [Lentisphaeria bacterium]|nr:30S ribosomal protein S9 [Lentisphaerota bacterium]MBR7145618.1 30S ribosomal protein S9 [Lentisphaeria bacterium]
MANSNEILATGRRKCAVARVRMVAGTGKVTVNGKNWEEYFTTEALRGFIAQPFQVSGTVDKFDLNVRLDGGGMSGQAGALRHGIARALVAYDESYRAVLKSNGMMTRDARVKERKKPGQPGARKRFQFSKR